MTVSVGSANSGNSIRWLQRLHEEHPFLFDLLAAGIALVLFGLVMLLKWLVAR